MAVVSAYEQRRLKNLEENRRILLELGVSELTATLNSHQPPPSSSGKRFSLKFVPKKVKQHQHIQKEEENEENVEPHLGRDAIIARQLAAQEKRRSARLSGIPAKRYREGALEHCESDEDDWRPTSDASDSDGSDGEKRRKTGRSRYSSSGRVHTKPGKLYVSDRPRVEPGRPNFFGAVPSIDIGTVFPSRVDACIAGVHRPTVAGIHGGPEGCYSLALSGGYEDDVDMGESFTYTGEGGRDLKGTKGAPKNLRTAPQSKDQTLSRGNKALTISVETGKPLRVLRGYKLDSPFAPEEGYRYDGLYRVEKYWYTIGMSGFLVYKFALKRIPDQPPPPWDMEITPVDNETSNEEDNCAPEVQKRGVKRGREDSLSKERIKVDDKVSDELAADVSPVGLEVENDESNEDNQPNKRARHLE